jgi:hypothetical protein
MTAKLVTNNGNCKYKFTIIKEGDENTFDFYGVY